MTLAKLVALVNNVRKALLSAAAVATTLSVTVGVPSNVKAWAAEVVAVLAVGGITWVVPNKPKP